MRCGPTAWNAPALMPRPGPSKGLESGPVLLMSQPVSGHVRLRPQRNGARRAEDGLPTQSRAEDRLPCGNVHCIFPNYAIRMWMKTADGGLAAVLYGPVDSERSRGRRGSAVRITQTTDYPFGERIEFRIDAEGPVTFPLALRVPGWCPAPRLEIDGKPVAASRDDNGFIVLRRTFTPGDRIVLTLPMKLAVKLASEWHGDRARPDRGTLCRLKSSGRRAWNHRTALRIFRVGKLRQ